MCHKCTRCGVDLGSRERCGCMGSVGSRGREARAGAPRVQEGATGGQHRFHLGGHVGGAANAQGGR